MAEPGVEQVALCVLVKTADPRIEWQLTQRTGNQVLEYLSKVKLVAREIAVGRFYKRSGLWCSWCDFLPVCLGDEKRSRQTLIHVP